MNIFFFVCAGFLILKTAWDFFKGIDEYDKSSIADFLTLLIGICFTVLIAVNLDNINKSDERTDNYKKGFIAGSKARLQPVIRQDTTYIPIK